MITVHHPANAVEVKSLTKSFTTYASGLSTILDGITFSVQTGEVVGIFGPSGCGKSTLLRILCGVLKQDAGEVYMFGEPLRNRRGHVAYVPQRSALLQWQTVWNNALLGWTITRRCRADSETIARAHALFARFGLASVAHQYPEQCSGGERQRTALIRALLTPVSMMALDEPVAAIDHITRARIYEMLLGVVQEQETEETTQPLTILMVSHDPEELLLLCDRILVMSQRPATLVDTIQVPFPRPRQSSLKFTSEFVELKRMLWSLLS